jgi:hypothetical protein
MYVRCRTEVVAPPGALWAHIVRDPLKTLTGCSDAASLNCAIQKLCAESGIVARVDIVTLARSGKRQALCFLRVDPVSHEGQLIGTPGLIRLGNELLFIADLPPEAAGAEPPYAMTSASSRSYSLTTE